MSSYKGNSRYWRWYYPIAAIALSVLSLFFALALMANPQRTAAQPPIASMTIARSGHTATLLPDGRILVTGGHSSLTTAEIYDPIRNQWSDAGNMSAPRSGHTATLLPNGQVLVLGGSLYSSTRAELYDPTTGHWKLGGEPRIARSGHTATLLKDGTVLVAGGATSAQITTAEIYTPTTNQWRDTGNMSSLRWRHTATLLPNGQVLVAGGSPAVTAAERYDPTSGEWRAAGKLGTQRDAHTATLLPNGQVLIAGGSIFAAEPYPPPGNQLLQTSTEVYSQTTNKWTIGASMISSHWGHTATLLPDGRVLVIGGYTGYYLADNTVEIFDPAKGRWLLARPLTSPRAYHTATLLADGTVLVIGGVSQGQQLNTAERYDPRDAEQDVLRFLPPVKSAPFVPPFGTSTPILLPTATPAATEEFATFTPDD